ncbi:predicted protein [Aspergillus nidulans FGSC A4]|uniref:Uncharacterized protein n=1 Tax=Emericella nidulans (strain FGSC A4 / ATCC 38163 / CBS 112.46 / NRRL 194 / M139) TaxID=227321 RepID=Q5BH81_EMENI|nr:hypothetical protein [Aspergillus nidulans FGSC A4]EAA65277.1 predicted protein [Aspergillus nidulans FGSC A4]CBF90201.1 TPA: conserved hypothetical protein [Aspergillus nidulans FGSC A4]|eukprot:XP_657703.1 predicted protein [Aspergillus nidulans FGSC A4]
MYTDKVQRADVALLSQYYTNILSPFTTASSFDDPVSVGDHSLAASLLGHAKKSLIPVTQLIKKGLVLWCADAAAARTSVDAGPKFPRARSSLDAAQGSSIRSYAYLKNALAAVPQLILLPPSISSKEQCQSSPDRWTHCSCDLAAACPGSSPTMPGAFRVGRTKSPNLLARVFTKQGVHYSSSTTTPTDKAHNDEDPVVQLPEKTTVDNVGIDLADGSKVPIFRLLSSLRHSL